MTANLCAALVAALADLTVVEKGRTAKAGAYSYDYADLGDIVKDTRPVLASHGLAVLTPLGAHGDDLAVSVLIVHTSGETMTFGPFPFPHGKDAQATGSMVTYHRRYALLAALGMATGEDDDGAAAQPRQKAQERPVERPKPLAGFLDADDQLTQHDDLAETVKASGARDHMKAWREANGIPWPMTKAQLDAAFEEVARFNATPKGDDPTAPFDTPHEFEARAVASKAREKAATA